MRPPHCLVSEPRTGLEAELGLLFCLLWSNSHLQEGWVDWRGADLGVFHRFLRLNPPKQNLVSPTPNQIPSLLPIPAKDPS